MPSGKVKFFNAEKGFGFLSNDEGDDVFVHRDALPDGMTELKPGTRVEYSCGRTSSFTSTVIRRSGLASDTKGRPMIKAVTSIAASTTSIGSKGRNFSFMPRKFDLDDRGLVLIIGSGAGGGTLGKRIGSKGDSHADSRGLDLGLNGSSISMMSGNRLLS